MEPPEELTVRLSSAAILGRIVRAALRYGTTRLPEGLVPDEIADEIIFHFEAADFDKTVTVVGQRTGAADGGLVPFKFRPRTRVSAAELFLIGEMIEAQPETIPPPAAETSSEEDVPVFSSFPPEDTVVDRCVVEAVRAKEGSMPPSSKRAPPSSKRAPPSSKRAAGVRSPPPAQQPLLDRLIAGKYRLDSLLGAGNAGAVWRGMHTDLGRPVAVKVLHAQNQGATQFVKRFKAEARAASRLDHRNVTRVLDFGEEPDGLLYLVMEFVDGKSLEAILQSEGRIPVARVVDIGIQTCGALAIAHHQSIIHRDIKPENLLLVPSVDDELNPTDLVKVCDFGMAKLKSEGAEDLTIGGMICGSPAYMSPEQIMGKELDARSDIYALGMTMYEALTGAHPFTAETLVELFMKHQTEKPRPPSVFVPGIDPLLEEIILRTLAKRPEDRHDSARTLRIELREVAEQLKEAAPPSSIVESR